VVKFNPEILQAGGGSGVSLLIAKGIIEQHGGKIYISSEGEGKGSTFTVEVPMIRTLNSDAVVLSVKSNVILSVKSNYEKGGEIDILGALEEDNDQRIDPDTMLAGGGPGPSEMAHPQCISILHANNCEVDGSSVVDDNIKTTKHTMTTTFTQNNSNSSYAGYKILIVDDSAMTRKMLRKTFIALGHSCDEAENGHLAVETIKQQLNETNTFKYDCILMDFVMPEMDGPTATRRIRELGYKRPIYGVTGNTVESDIETFIKSGANQVFSKPFSIDKFITAMQMEDT
jgi:CheY-like chemotaxis protein